MLKIKNALVRSLSSLYNELSWEIENTTKDPWDYTFTIYRSESQGGPWDQITGAFTDRYYYIDDSIPKYRKSRQLFYKIKITRRSDSEESWSEVFTVDGPSNKYVDAMSRVERLVFRKFSGQRVLILPIRTFGFRCGCWDSISGKRIGGDCNLCFNTGFVGGYMSGIETYAQINADPVQISSAHGQETEPKANNIVLTNYPVVKPYDLIIQPDINIRWRIATVAPTRLGGALVHQNLTVAGIDTSDPEYQISLDEDTVLRLNRPNSLSRMRTTV